MVRAPRIGRIRQLSQRVEVATGSYRALPYTGDVRLLRPMDSGGDAGWGALIDGRLLIERTPGDHVSMVRGAAATVAAAKLDHALAVAQDGPPTRATAIQLARAI